MPRACLEIVSDDVARYLGFISEVKRSLASTGGSTAPAGVETGWLIGSSGRALLVITLSNTLAPLAPNMLAGQAGIRAYALIEGEPGDIVALVNMLLEAGARHSVRLYPAPKQC